MSCNQDIETCPCGTCTQRRTQSEDHLQPWLNVPKSTTLGTEDAQDAPNPNGPSQLALDRGANHMSYGAPNGDDDIGPQDVDGTDEERITFVIKTPTSLSRSTTPTPSSPAGQAVGSGESGADVEGLATASASSRVRGDV